jgi:hypothetical protein
VAFSVACFAFLGLILETSYDKDSSASDAPSSFYSILF